MRTLPVGVSFGGRWLAGNGAAARQAPARGAPTLYPFLGLRWMEMRPLPVLAVIWARGPLPNSLLPNALWTPPEPVLALRSKAASGGSTRVMAPLPVLS